MSQGLIQGVMREAPLPDIIQLMCQGGRTGCFNVTDEARRAKLYLKDGKICHAVTSGLEGLDAVYEVALWLDGHYSFEEVSEDIPVTITKTNAAVLMEMHRRMDEWRVISQKVASLDLYPVSTLLPGEQAAGASPREARLLPLLTGYYTVHELAEIMQKPVLTVAKDIYGLVMAGHVMLKGIRSGRKPELPESMAPAAAEAAPVPTPVPAPVPEPVEAPAAPEPVAAAPAPEPIPVPATVPAPVPAVEAPRSSAELDPQRIMKLNAFAQRILQVATSNLPVDYHDMVLRLHARATQQITLGEGPDAVKNLALSISRSVVDAGADPELVRTLNASLKALFNKQ